MEHCTTCGAELPEDARFCGQCGHLAGSTIEVATRMQAFPMGNLLSADAPTTLSDQSHPTYEGEQRLLGKAVLHNWPQKRQHVPDPKTPSIEGTTVWHHWSQEEKQQIFTPTDDEGDEEERRRRAAILGLPLLGVLAREEQVPHVPLVQGTPQQGGVPRVQGTPPFALVSGTPYTPDMYSKSTLHSSPTNALHPPHHHAQSPHPSHPHPKGCLIIAFIALVIIASFISALFFLFPPSLSLSGSGMVTSGGTLNVQGGGFLPGSSVTLTLDGGLPPFAVAPNAPTVAHYDGAFAVGAGFSAPVGTQVVSNNVIKANADGTFHVTITANQSLSIGPHTLRAVENIRSLSAQITFEVTAQPGKLQVGPASLDFGMLKTGSKATQAVTVSNMGQQAVNWTADTGNASWLSLDSSAQTLQPGTQQTIQVTVDTTKLSAGTYSATIQINSDGGNKAVTVSLVVNAPPVPPAQLNVSPSSLNYSFTDVAATDSQPITIANTGGSALNWKATLATPSSNNVAVSLEASSGTNLAGGASTVIHVIVKTPGVARTETITSSVTISATDPTSGNPVAGSSQTVSITITITAPPPPPPSLTVNPTSLDTTPSSGCTFARASNSWACTVTLAEDVHGQGNLDWSVTTDLKGAAFSQLSGRLSPGQSVQVTISGIPCRNGSFTFSGGAQPVTVSWSCSAPPPLG